MLKLKLRKKILRKRKLLNKGVFKIKLSDILIILKKNKSKKLIGGYFPVNFEIDDLEILRELARKNYKISLPVIKKNYDMNFYSWSDHNPLLINKFGIPEPISKKKVIPDILFVPLVAFDKNLNRLGYGGGYYDRLIQKLELKKKILKIGFAFSFQKVSKIPTSKHDKKLDYVITEKSIYQ